MHRAPIVLATLVTAVAVVVAAPPPGPRAEQPEKYKLMDAARPQILAALDQGDGKALEAFVPEAFETRLLWFDSATCRKRFGNAKVTSKDLGALATCFAAVGVQPSGLLGIIGPGVTMTVRLDVVDGKVRIHSLNGGHTRSDATPLVANKQLEANRTAGDTAPPASAQPLLAALPGGMAAFDVCVDKKGRVTSHKLAPDIKDRKLDGQIKATVRTWTFKPFTVRGKAVAVCSSVVWQQG